jgi:hypothetical protein
LNLVRYTHRKVLKEIGMYQDKQEESMNGIAGMFFLFATAMSALIVFAMPYLVRGGFVFGTFVGNSLKRLFSKK